MSTNTIWQESGEREFKSPAKSLNPEKLKLDIQNLEDERRDMERQAQAVGSQYTLGVVGVIAGLALLVFTSVYWLGGLLFVAGALAVLTQGSKKRGALKRIQSLSAQIRDKRSDLARLLE